MLSLIRFLFHGHPKSLSSMSNPHMVCGAECRRPCIPRIQAWLHFFHLPSSQELVRWSQDQLGGPLSLAVMPATARHHVLHGADAARLHCSREVGRPLDAGLIAS